MRNGNPNTKTAQEIDTALREASLANGGDGDIFRRTSKGHQFEFSASRHDCPNPSSLGQSLADAMGCRVKVSGYSDDGRSIMGHIDADNWNLDQDGVTHPFADGCFELIDSEAFVPADYEIGADELAAGRARALRERSEAPPAPKTRADSEEEPELTEAEAAILSSLSKAPSAPIKSPPASSGSLSVSDPALAHIDASAEIRLALALREAGVDIGKLKLALERLAKP